jgi:DNA-binding NtrC family response regulator
MRTTKPLALQIGDDPALLRTRAGVLRLAGLRVLNLDPHAEYADAIRMENFDLVVLCHSLSPSKRKSITSLIHRHKPRVPVFLVSSSEGCPEGITAILPCQPQSLVADLSLLLLKLPADPTRQPHLAH